MTRSKKFQTFDDWQTQAENASPEIRSTEFYKGLSPGHKTQMPDDLVIDTILKQISAAAQSGKIINVAELLLKNPPQQFGPWILRSDKSKKIRIKHLHLDLRGSELELVGCQIRTLRIAPNCNLVLRNCEIGTLTLESNSIHTRLTIRDCILEKINFTNKCCKFLQIESTCIGTVICPHVSDGKAFLGDVNFSKIEFKPHKIETDSNIEQQFRNLRSQLLELNNSLAAGPVHKAELMQERRRDNLCNKALSYIYQFICDFGNSPSRPLIQFIVLWILLFVFLCGLDGAAPNVHMLEEVSGWQQGVVNSNWKRSLYLATESMIKPWHLIPGERSLITPVSGWIATILIVCRFISAILIAAFIISLRRRFKITG